MSDDTENFLALKARLHKLHQHEVIRFLVSGGTNTAVSWLLYLLLITILVPYTLAYSIAFAFGIVLTYYLNTRWVFKVAMSWRSFLQFPLVYLAQYGLGMFLLVLLVDMWHLPKAYGPPVVTLIALPLTFVLSRFILKRPTAAK